MRTTPIRPPRVQPIQLHPVAQRLKSWRARRAPGQRIPDELWKAAADLARIHGLSPTATALKLSYYDLQRRLRAARPRPAQPSAQAQFVELAPPARRRSRKLTRLCSQELTHLAEGRMDFFSKEERFGSEEGDSELAGWSRERGKVSGRADAGGRSSLWRRDAGGGWRNEGRACAGP